MPVVCAIWSPSPSVEEPWLALGTATTLSSLSASVVVVDTEECASEGQHLAEGYEYTCIYLSARRHYEAREEEHCP